MKAMPEGLESHLSKSATNLCYCWILKRADGEEAGFTDHDRPLMIEGIECKPSTGFSAGLVEQSLGLSADTTDVAGALSDEGISEADILAGRYDGAAVTHYLVNWSDPNQRMILSRSRIGEITREGESFRVELRSFAAA